MSDDDDDDDDHDPWNNPEDRHPRAQELMAPELWDCTHEWAPFGSDEGADAYSEFRDWRERHPNAPLVDCISWIGDEDDYPDEFTFDATIIATVLGQLVDEGRIDHDAKPFARAAIRRQALTADEDRLRFLRLTESAIEAG
jgi:uncharacterized protein YfeS